MEPQGWFCQLYRVSVLRFLCDLQVCAIDSDSVVFNSYPHFPLIMIANPRKCQAED